MRSLCVWALLVAAACSEEPTAIELDITYEPTWALDQLDLALRDTRVARPVTNRVRVLVPDAWAGSPVPIQIEGTRQGLLVARGDTEVTPIRGTVTAAPIVLTAIPGAVCETAAACDEAPPPICVSPTTLRTSMAPGRCEDDVCVYPHVDRECPYGCDGGQCVCLSITDAMPASIGLTTVVVDRTFEIDGQPVPSTTTNGWGRLYLRNTLTDDEIAWGQTSQASAPVRILTGRYDVFYEHAGAGTGGMGVVTVPRNDLAKIATLDVTTSTTVELDVPVVVVDRTFRVNGATVASTTTNGYGNLVTRDVVTGDMLPWGLTTQASSPLRLVAGSYDVLYEWTQSGTGAGGAVTVPRNDNATIAHALALTSSQTVTLDVPVVTVDRTFRIGGQLVPDASANGSGTLWTRDTENGDVLAWGTTTQASVPMRLVAGTYDVTYEWAQSGTGAANAVTVPRNDNATIAKAIDVTTTQAVALDIAVVTVDRTFRVNGQPVTDSTTSGYGRLRTRDVVDDDWLQFGQTNQASSPLRLIARSYDVVYEWVQSGTGTGGAQTVPRNDRVTVASAIDVGISPMIAIDVPVVTMDRTFTVNGQAVPDSVANGYGMLWTQDVTNGDQLQWGQTNTNSSPMRLVAGTYDVIYEWKATGSGAVLVPRNDFGVVRPAVAMTTSATVALDAKVISADRVITVDGAAVPDTSINGAGNLFLYDVPLDDSVPWGRTTSPSPMRMLAGTYDVYYQFAQAGTGAGGAVTVPANTSALLMCVQLE